MSRRALFLIVLTSFLPIYLTFTALGQQPAGAPAQGKAKAAAAKAATKEFAEDHRPPLFFRESWKNPFDVENAQEPKVRQEYMTAPNLELKLYGPENMDVRIVNHKQPSDDPTYIWTGSSPTNWLLMMRDKNNFVDLSGTVAKIRWRTKEAGFHLLRPVVKLADGTFLVGDHTESYAQDWLVTEFTLADVRWRGLDIGRGIVETADGQWKTNVDLSKVDEIGFTDLMRGSGGGPGGGTRVDWMEVYGNPVPRSGQSGSNN